MDEFESLSHTKWECKYHVVFIPKYRRKVLYGELKQYLGPVFRQLAEQRESRVEEGHLMPDHVHMLLSIPPKYAVSQVVGYIKGQERDPSWRGFMASESEGSSVKVSGREDISSRPSVETKRSSGTISRTRRTKTKELEQLNLWR